VIAQRALALNAAARQVAACAIATFGAGNVFPGRAFDLVEPRIVATLPRRSRSFIGNQIWIAVIRRCPVRQVGFWRPRQGYSASTCHFRCLTAKPAEVRIDVAGLFAL
jgi:hypothetical protein